MFLKTLVHKIKNSIFKHKNKKEGEQVEYRQEKKIEQYLCNRVKEIGGYAMKITSPGMAGVPDRLILFNGVAAFVELKAAGGKPTERQIAIHRFLHRLGFPVCVADSKHKVDCLVREVERRGFSTT